MNRVSTNGLAPARAASANAEPLVSYNPFLPEFRRDPYPIYAAIRRQGRVHRFTVSRISQWLLTHYEDVRGLLADARFVADDLPLQIEQKKAFADRPDDLDVLIRCIRHWLFFRNGADHGLVRRVFSKAMSPIGIAAHRREVESLVAGIVNEVRDEAQFDLIARIAYPLPTRVMARLVGIPDESLDRLMEWSTELFRIMVPPQSIESYQRMRGLVADFEVFLRPHIEQRRHRPGQGDLLDLLVAAERGGVLDEANVYALAIMLFSVGQETTENLIGNGLLALLSDPTQRALAWSRPELCADTVDEMLRFDTPVQGVARIAQEDVAVGDDILPAGARVNFALGAANRDPAVFHDPDRFVIQRPVRSKLVFGAGIHFCLGAHLARLQAEAVLAALTANFPDLHLVPSNLEWRPSVLVRGLKALPVAPRRAAGSPMESA